MNQLKLLWDKSFTDLRFRSLLHIGFWFFFLSSWLAESMVLKINAEQHILVTLVGITFVWYLYYTLIYLIWPLFQHRKWLWFTVSLLAYYVVAVALRSYHIELIIKWYNLHETSVEGDKFFKHLYESQLRPIALIKVIFSGFSSLISIIYIPLTLKFIRYAYQFSQRQAWMEKENTQLQLNTLKAQLNPHFFFNTLNNLQSFIVQNERQKSVELLNRLADFMRSSIYDGEKEMMSIEKEIELLSNYVAIEKVRFEEDAAINLNLINTGANYQIPPFIFLPFVENVFKHGGSLPSNEIQIYIELNNSPTELTLITSNKFDQRDDLGLEYHGIGLKNIRKRLDYYFKNRYQLEIFARADQFNVTLKITK